MSIFIGVTWEVGMLVIIVTDHKFVILLATFAISAAIPSTHSSARSPKLHSVSGTVVLSVDLLLFMMCTQTKGAVGGKLSVTTDW